MKTPQLTDTLLMIRPVKFGFNAETAENNLYQKQLAAQTPEDIQVAALREFTQFVQKLEAAGVRVIVIDDTSEPSNPDSIFPNNWITTHHDSTVVTYPMWAPSRRLERRDDIIETLRQHGYQISRKIDYSGFEEEEQYLEGTGSMILDRVNRIAYACMSPRTHHNLFGAFCREFGFKPFIFIASQTTAEGALAYIYHTNVMMSVGEDVAVLCNDAIRDTYEQDLVNKSLQGSGKQIVHISEAQCNHFAGNMLQIRNKAGEKLLVMSEQAFQSLTDDQIEKLSSRSRIIHSPLDTIEACGGGSARCMMAEIFLPKKI